MGQSAGAGTRHAAERGQGRHHWLAHFEDIERFPNCVVEVKLFKYYMCGCVGECVLSVVIPHIEWANALLPCSEGALLQSNPCILHIQQVGMHIVGKLEVRKLKYKELLTASGAEAGRPLCWCLGGTQGGLGEITFLELGCGELPYRVVE